MQTEVLLRARDISYSQGNRLILDQVSFELKRAQITTIIGPNGAGKTTLTNIVNGLISNFEGEIERAADLRIGYLPQKVYVNRLMPLSVERLLRLTRVSSDAEIEHALAQSEVGYLRQRQVHTLSEGELKRVLLARTTLGNPDLIVLDEPNTNLDQPGERALLATIAELKQAGKTLVIIAHRPNILASVDHILCLNEGVVDMLGTRDEVIARFTLPPPVLDGPRRIVSIAEKRKSA